LILGYSHGKGGENYAAAFATAALPGLRRTISSV
jgi:hypothetical protein